MLVFQPVGWRECAIAPVSRRPAFHCESSCMSSHHDHQKGLLITAIGGLTLTVDIPLIRLADGGAWTIMLLRTGTTFVAAMVIWSVWRSLSRNAPPVIPGWSGPVLAFRSGFTRITFGP